VARASASAQASVDSLLDSVTREWRTSVQFEVFSRELSGLARNIRRKFLPANWHEVKLPKVGVLRSLVLDEGLPLAWTVPPAVLQRILDAPSPARRRGIIGESWGAILQHCRSELDHLTSREGRQYAYFISASITSIESGHREAGQALAANTLDTIMTRYGFSYQKSKSTPDVSDLGMVDTLVLGALWAAYRQFWGRTPDAVVPQVFLRHATAHGVSRRQYSLRNATLAVMHLMAVARWCEVHGWQDQRL
jgi:hypothetical protein